MALLKIEPYILDSTANFTFANANITANLLAGNANITGNLISGNANLGNLATANYFSGDGGLLSNISATVAKSIANGTSNVNIAASGGNVTVGVGGTGGIATFTTTGVNVSGYVNATGNITGGNASLGNLVSANYFTGTLTTAAQPNITSVGTLSGLTVNGNTTITGNLIVAGNTTYVNSTAIDLEDPILTQGGGANNATLTVNDGMDRGSVLNYYVGSNGSGTATQAFMGWKAANSEFEFGSNVSLNNNVVTINTYGNIKAGSANLGNSVTSNYFIGSGNNLSNIQGANVTGQVGNALVAGTVYGNAQGNITSVGTLTTLAIAGTGSVTGANLVSANYFTGTLTTAAQPNIT